MKKCDSPYVPLEVVLVVSQKLKRPSVVKSTVTIVSNETHSSSKAEIVMDSKRSSNIFWTILLIVLVLDQHYLVFIRQMI